MAAGHNTTTVLAPMSEQRSDNTCISNFLRQQAFSSFLAPGLLFFHNGREWNNCFNKRFTAQIKRPPAGIKTYVVTHIKAQKARPSITFLLFPVSRVAVQNLYLYSINFPWRRGGLRLLPWNVWISNELVSYLKLKCTYCFTKTLTCHMPWSVGVQLLRP